MICQFIVFYDFCFTLRLHINWLDLKFCLGYKRTECLFVCLSLQTVFLRPKVGILLSCLLSLLRLLGSCRIALRSLSCLLFWRSLTLLLLSCELLDDFFGKLSLTRHIFFCFNHLRSKRVGSCVFLRAIWIFVKLCEFLLGKLFGGIRIRLDKRHLRKDSCIK